MSTIHPTLVLKAGATWEFVGPMTDNNGNPLPLAGAQFYWRLDSLDFSTNYITLVLGQGIEITNLATATIEYGPSDTQTAGLVPGTYYDVLSVVLADGTEFPLVEGFINVSPQPQ
jgi:hypothetical protein